MRIYLEFIISTSGSAIIQVLCTAGYFLGMHTHHLLPLLADIVASSAAASELQRPSHGAKVG